MKQFKRNIGLLVLLFLSSQIITLGKADLENPDREEQKIQQIESLLQKSDKYLHLDLFDQAFVYADSALQLANSIEHIESITQSLLSESNIYFVQKKFAKAINIYFELIYYFNSTDNIESNAFVYKQIAYLYTKLKKYDNAIIYFNKSIGYSEKIGNDKTTANLNIDRGRVMVLNNELANAEESFRKALEIAIELNNRYLIIKSKIELALLYDIAGNVDAAETTINAIEQLLIKSENDTLKAEYFHALSSIMFHSRSFDDAVNNSKKSLALCREMDIPDLIESNFKLLQEIAISQRNYKTALLHSNKYAEYLILKSQEQHSETLRDSQIVLEIEHQEKELEKLRAEKIHQQELLYGKTRLIYALFALGLMAMIVALLLYFRAKSRKKAIEKEKKQKEKIERQNKRLAKTNEKLAEAKADAEFARDSAIKADKAKTAFLDIMSHEIRTPIAGIIGMINVLKDIDLDDDKREKLFIIEQSSNDLLDIFNDILEFVKLESGNLVIEKSEFSLRNAISEVELLNVNRAKKKGLVLKVNIDKEIPDSLVGDEMRIQQVLKSLLSNAIKFTEKGKVVLNIKYFGQTVDNCSFRVEVIDTGIGMTMSEIKSIFTAFSAVNTSFSREYQGIGLSLAIVKKLVHLMKSAVQVESSKGSGSRFWFDMEMQCNKENYKAVKAVGTTTHVDTEFKILLAEDNVLMQKVGSANLSKYGEVDIAEDGQKAIVMYKSNKYNIIVMDLQMPNMDGWEATQHIREYEKKNGVAKKIPIVALTANVSQKDRNKSFEVGMDYFAEKPIRPEVLDKIFNEIRFR